MKAIILMTLTLILATGLAALTDLPRPSFSPYQADSSPLFDLSRLSMRHSLGFSAGTSSSGDGFYMSRYTNHLSYQFSPKLDLDLDLHFVNFGTAGSGFKINDDNSSKVIPDFRLSYRPSNSFRIEVQMIHNNPFQTAPRPWYERW